MDLRQKAAERLDARQRQTIAQDVFKDLKDIVDNQADYRQRWVWELLQNARDVAHPETGVSVDVVLTAQALTFAHDGLPFTLDNVATLVHHGSTKKEDAIGQFGTGFITTHVLSSRLVVMGCLNSGETFNFELHRPTTSATELADAMKSSWDRFLDSCKLQEQQTTKTQYIYPLNEPSLKIAQDGLEMLLRNAAYVLTFNQSIRSITVTNQDRRYSLTRKKHEHQELRDCRIEEFVETENDQTGLRHTAQVSKGDATVAIELKRVQEGWKVVPPKETPRLFVAFPVLGSHQISLPAIANSRFFVITEQRNELPLSGDSPSNMRNRKRLRIASRLAARLTRICSGQKWENAYCLANVPSFGTLPWAMTPWLGQMLKNHVIRPIRSAALLRATNGQLLAPLDALIPKHDNELTSESLWTLANAWAPIAEKLPDSKEREAWSAALVSWQSFGLTDEELKEQLTLRMLCQSVEAASTVAQLQANLLETTDARSWLKQLHEAIFATKQKTLVLELKLLLNQRGELQRGRDLSIDAGIDNELKDIADALGLNVRSSLVDTAFDHPDLAKLFAKPKSNEDLVKEIEHRLRSKRSDLSSDKKFRDASVAFVGWIIRNGRIAVLSGLPVCTRAAAGDGSYLRDLSTKSNEQDSVLLPPASTWPNGAQFAVDLFPPGDVLAEDYSTLPPDAWKKLHEHGFVLSSLMYPKKQLIKEFLAEDPPKGDDKEAEHESKVQVFATTIASLNGIMERVANSQARATLLLKFLLDYVVPNDQTTFAVSGVECSCQSKHAYYQAAWLETLWRKSWVRLGEKRSRATAESLAKLANSDPSVRSAVLGKEGAQLLKALHVNRADILVRTISDSEEAQISFIETVVAIAGALRNNSAELHLLAGELEASPALMEEVKLRRENRLRTQRNQRIGKAVEDALAAALSTRNIKVTPAPIGSDFSLEPAYEIESDFVENGNEVHLNLESSTGKCLVEVKSTITDVAKMTPKQVETATGSIRFALCVVRHNGDAVDEAYVQHHARFVIDIGKRVAPVFARMHAFETSKTEAIQPYDGIELVVSDAQRRVAVHESVWLQGKTFEEFVQWIAKT